VIWIPMIGPLPSLRRILGAALDKQKIGPAPTD